MSRRHYVNCGGIIDEVYWFLNEPARRFRAQLRRMHSEYHRRRRHW